MMRAALRIFVVICLGLCAVNAAAQDEIDEARKSRLKMMGVYVTPTLQLKEFGIDSNVFNQPGEQTPDFTATLSPGANLAVPFTHRALVTSHVDADFVYYARYANQRSINPNVTLRAKAFAHRLTLFGGGSYLNSRERLNQEIDARARRLDESVDAGLELRLAAKVSVSATALAGRIDYTDDQVFRGVDLRRALAEDFNSVPASIKYRVTPLTTFVLRGEARQDRFLYSQFKDGDSYRVTPGVEFKPRALIAGSAYVGYGHLSPQNALVPKFGGVVATLSLRYTLRSATAFTVTTDRDVQYSYQQTAPYFVSTAVGVLIRRQLTGPFDATVGAQRYNYAYRDLELPGVSPLAPRVDITHNFSSDIGYRLGRKGRMGIGVSYWTRASNRAAEVGYSGFRFGSTITYVV